MFGEAQGDPGMTRSPAPANENDAQLNDMKKDNIYGKTASFLALHPQDVPYPRRKCDKAGMNSWEVSSTDT